MELLYPDRPLRTEPSLESPDYAYYDHEVVVQEDGRYAAFTGNSHEREKGWQFAGWKDAQGFWILEGNRQVDEFAQTLLDSTPKKRKARQEKRAAEEAKRPKLTAEEQAARWAKFTFPVITGIASASILPDLVAVQPMTGPVPTSDPTFKLDYGWVEPPRPTVGEDEELHEYRFGGVLAERGGWFVTAKNDPTRVLRYRQDMMS